MEKAQIAPNSTSTRSWRRGATLLVLMLACGCESMNNTDKGALAGAGIGAATGALIGSVSHHTALGAVAGGALGTITGALVGNGIDRSEKKAEAAAAVANMPPPLTLEGVASLAQQHVSDEVIIQQIRSTGSVYHLTPEQIEWLKGSGVSDPVVMEMQATAYRPVHHVYVADPGVYQTVYVAQPAPPPPVRIGVGFGFH